MTVASEPMGVCCPSCGRDDSKVTDSRPAPGGIRRRRQCACGTKFTGYEVVASDDAMRRRKVNAGSLVQSLKMAVPNGANFTVVGSNTPPNGRCPDCGGDRWQKIWGALWRCPQCGTTAEVSR